MRTLIILLMSILLIEAQSQPRPGKEKIREARIEFMKKKLALTPEEERNFIPKYEAMLNEQDSLRKLYKQEVDLEDLDLTFMTDKECEKVLADIIAFREKEVAILKKYDEEFRKVLPIKKVAMIHKAEHEFKKEILKRLRQEPRK